MGESAGLDAAEGGHLVFGRDWAISQIIAPTNDAVAGDFDQTDSFGFTRFEPHGGAGGNIEAFAKSFLPVEAQLGVGFDEMIMAADLDGAIAKVAYGQRKRFASGVQLELARLDFNCAGLNFVSGGRSRELRDSGDGEKGPVERQREAMKAMKRCRY